MTAEGTQDDALTGSEFRTITIEEADTLVLENQGWAESIARSVARSWNMDWRLDGLDGAALEALIFCARRFQPDRGVPFRGYARRRIHEASTDQARKCRGWRRGLSSAGNAEQKAREVSAQLLDVFPELRSGEMPFMDEGSSGGEADTRMAIRQMLVGATLVAAKEGSVESNQEELLDIKKMVRVIATMEPVHQALLWRVYWDGMSLRTVATEWETDGLNVIREHKVLLAYLFKSLSVGKGTLVKPKVRPGLKPKALELKKQNNPGPFSALLARGT